MAEEATTGACLSRTLLRPEEQTGMLKSYVHDIVHAYRNIFREP